MEPPFSSTLLEMGTGHGQHKITSQKRSFVRIKEGDHNPPGEFQNPSENKAPLGTPGCLLHHSSCCVILQSFSSHMVEVTSTA